MLCLRLLFQQYTHVDEQSATLTTVFRPADQTGSKSSPSGIRAKPQDGQSNTHGRRHSKLSRVLLRMPELTSQWTQNWNPGPMATGSWQDSQSLCCLHQRCNRLHFLHNGNIADSFWGHLMPEQSQPTSTNLRSWKQPFGQEQRLRSCATSMVQIHRASQRPEQF